MNCIIVMRLLAISAFCLYVQEVSQKKFGRKLTIIFWEKTTTTLNCGTAYFFQSLQVQWHEMNPISKY